MSRNEGQARRRDSQIVIPTIEDVEEIKKEQLRNKAESSGSQTEWAEQSMDMEGERRMLLSNNPQYQGIGEGDLMAYEGNRVGIF